MNDAPVLDPVGDQAVDEENLLSFTATASDPNDDPANDLSFSLDAASLALGMTIDPLTGLFNWTPSESQQGVYSVTITVTDDGVSPLGDSETITHHGGRGQRRAGAGRGGRTRRSNEQETLLTFTADGATRTTTRPTTLTFSLDAASLPLGMTIDPLTGLFNWTPSESQQGVYSVTITVTDDGISPLSDSETITITVNEVNDAPVLDPIGDQAVDEENLLSFTATATDPNDDPANDLTFSLDRGLSGLGDDDRPDDGPVQLDAERIAAGRLQRDDHGHRRRGLAAERLRDDHRLRWAR